MTLASSEENQHSLFESLPIDEVPPHRRRRAARRVAAPADGQAPRAVATAQPVAAVPVAAEPAQAQAQAPAHQGPAVATTVDAASLTNPELADLIAALSDVRLSFLLVEATRALKRRIQPQPWDDEGEPGEPNPSLLRAAQAIVAELTEEE